VFYFEDDAQHLNDIQTALQNNPSNDRLYLIEIDHGPLQPDAESLRDEAWSVLREGFHRRHTKERQMHHQELQKIALEHGRGLFIYHAGQRVQSIGQYFAALAFLSAAGVGILNARQSLGLQKWAGVIFCAIGFIITACLWAIDRRNQRLVEVDETLLRSAERAFGDVLFENESKTGTRVETPFETIEYSNKKYSWFGERLPFEPIQYKYVSRVIFPAFLVLWMALVVVFLTADFSNKERSGEAGRVVNSEGEPTAKPPAAPAAKPPVKPLAK
jgi:hypothetical protein